MRWFFSAERALFFCFYATRTGRQTTVRQKAWEIPLALASGELSRMAGMAWHWRWDLPLTVAASFGGPVY
jgi:hypothetical protein